MPPDLTNIAFGRLRPAKTSPKTLKLESYVKPIVAPPPESVHWAQNVPVPWPAYWNHKLSDCTIAAIGHIIQVWTMNDGRYNAPPDSAILQAYEAISGYSPSKPGSDTGCYMLDTLNYWWNTGIGVNRHKITGFASVNPFARNDDLLRWAIFNFGAVYIGLVLPPSAVNQYHAGQPFTIVNDSTGIGQYGHAIPIFGYDANWLYTVTWGAPKKLSYDWYWKYVEESYTMLTPDWKPILGFDQARFEGDVAAIRKAA